MPKNKNQTKDFDYSRIASPLAEELIGRLVRFPDECLDMSKSYEVHHLTHYLQELAGVLHRYYNEEKFIDLENKVRSQELLCLLVAVKKVIAQSLELLGISAPEKM
jgi:arginyl-tRNA synthetase